MLEQRDWNEQDKDRLLRQAFDDLHPRFTFSPWDISLKPYSQLTAECQTLMSDPGFKRSIEAYLAVRCPMARVLPLQGRSLRDRVSAREWDTRVDLAACYRLVALYGMTDLVYNHITARVPGADEHVLINPYGMLYEEITASSLIKIDLEGKTILQPDHDYSVNAAGSLYDHLRSLQKRQETLAWPAKLRLAVECAKAIDFLVTEKHLSREDAYALCSVAVDFNVTQAVDGTKGVHAMIPKSIFK